MRTVLLSFLIGFFPFGLQAQALPELPLWPGEKTVAADWLVTPVSAPARVYRSADNRELYLTNGLLLRRFRLTPNAATVSLKHLGTGEQFVRSVRPEARLTLNGRSYNIGGLMGQPLHAYLREEWLDKLTASAADFQLQRVQVETLKPYVNWKPKLWATNPNQPTGQTLSFTYTHRAPELKDLTVTVHYGLYDGLPLLVKWLTVQNGGTAEVTLDAVTNEILAVPEEESAVVGRPDQMQKPARLYIESNYAFNNAMKANLSDQTTHWKTDSLYRSQVNYEYQTPCLLEVHPSIGPGVTLSGGASFTSIRTHELLLDSYDRERNGLAKRRMYRTIAPWTTQNPIFMHLISTDPVKVRDMVDQCAATGYEMIILSFGSGLNMEDTSAANIQKFKALADYAHSKGILLGGYSLFSSRRISDADDVIDPKTGLPDKGAQFGAAPCLGSVWGLAYLKKLKKFITETGFDILEHDGPYPGDVCASTTHPGHKGLADSQWAQMEMQKGFYRWLNERGVYINAPDWYFLDGTHKIAMGYREVNFSLPRAEQIVHGRQHIFDGTWEKTPSMGWMFVPLTEYQGGGSAATIEPLSEHLPDYKALMLQNYGSGAQACYRGPRLYDTDVTKAVVSEVVQWYKTYRTVLNADLIHLRRPDGRDWDGMLHVDPTGKQKGLAILFNPLKEPITRTIQLPLYYTGLTGKARIRVGEGKPRVYPLNGQHEATVTLEMAPESMTWLLID
ncbi:alpha-galactosidase [Rudanella paleaurantiibacter]|uniref:Alpha-galactosidase n=1 Tax=Rudanella paleaurantiibacter TaxID=2614655 RepID=A0A7J5U463_9BACT|nr:alpha-galactosidase [Rudanella paleaurantiibacter]KAB7732521.1 alpha-galactosidase [Rudanella paleaurantiibacter]